MDKDLLVLIEITAAVGLVSALLTNVRADKIASASELAGKGLASVRRSNVVFFGLCMPLLVGVISFVAYRGMLLHSSDSAHTTFLTLALAVGVIFTIMAAIVFKLRGFKELTALHALYVVGFGWLFPMLAAT